MNNMIENTQEKSLVKVNENGILKKIMRFLNLVFIYQYEVTFSFERTLFSKQKMTIQRESVANGDQNEIFNISFNYNNYYNICLF